VAEFTKCQLIPSCCCQKKKELRNPQGFKETHNFGTLETMMDVLFPHVFSKGQSLKLVTCILQLLEVGRTGDLPPSGLALFLLRPRRLPERNHLLFLFIPRNNGS
jgi:hypothetical protein